MTIAKEFHHFVAAVICCLLCFCNVARSQTTTPDPQIILKKMIARYASLSSYQDSGVVRIVPGNPALATSLESPRFQVVSFQDDLLVSFKTYYASPRMFRFEWKSSFLPTSREAVIWSDGEKAYSWTPDMYPKNGGGFTLESGGNLRFYLGEARGSSGGAVFPVPSLLMEDVDYLPFGRMINSMRGSLLVREEEFDGETCYVIKGNIYGTPWVLWVGRESQLLRKTRTSYSRGGSFHEKMEKGIRKTFMAEEIHRDIRINEEIPKEVFKYKPQPEGIRQLEIEDPDAQWAVSAKRRLSPKSADETGHSAP
jgi:outer membrane lipoprotein-sorting protein